MLLRFQPAHRDAKAGSVERVAVGTDVVPRPGNLARGEAHHLTSESLELIKVLLDQAKVIVASASRWQARHT